MMMRLVSERRIYPFTASQWQELQLQVLIFEYMTSGVPIPPELIFLFKSGHCFFDPYYVHPLMSLGSVVEEDPEPGRCRRTDGKKWRCAKEAIPDSKYCERHVHRGKKVCSRKHVLTPLTTLSCSSTSNLQSLVSFSSQNDTANLHMDNLHYSPADRNCRYPNGEEDVHQRRTFSQGKERASSWQFTPLEMSSLGETQESYSASKKSSSTHFTRDEYKGERSQHCFVLGVDLKLQRPADVDREDDGAWKSRPLLHLFNECHDESSELSISIPR